MLSPSDQNSNTNVPGQSSAEKEEYRPPEEDPVRRIGAGIVEPVRACQGVLPKVRESSSMVGCSRVGVNLPRLHEQRTKNLYSRDRLPFSNPLSITGI